MCWCLLSLHVHGWCYLYYHGFLLPSLLSSICQILNASDNILPLYFSVRGIFLSLPDLLAVVISWSSSWTAFVGTIYELLSPWDVASYLSLVGYLCCFLEQRTALPLGCCLISITGWIFVLLPTAAPPETMMDSLCYWGNRLPLSLFLPCFIGVLHNVCSSFWFTVLSDF